MIELKVTGATPEEFLHQFDGLVSAIGHAYNSAKSILERAEVQHPEPVAGTPVDADPHHVLQEAPAAEPAKKRGRPAKPTVTIEAVAEAVVSEAAVPVTEPKEPVTLDSIRGRVMDIITAHKNRGFDMPEVTAYVMHLFKPFDIKKAAELAPEKWEEFIQVSQAYLDGTAKVD